MNRIMRVCFLLVTGFMLAALGSCSDRMTARQPAEPKITEAELRAFCPPVNFADDAAFYDIYVPGHTGNPGKVVYQAVISDVTRTCRYQDDRLELTIGVAGRIVPGPAFKATTITLPIEIKVMQGTQVLFSEIGRHAVAADRKAVPVQFIYKRDSVTIPQARARTSKVYVGFAVHGNKKTPAYK